MEEKEEKRREGVTHSYLPVLAHHVIWEGRRSRFRGVATVVLCCLQQTLCCTILTGREDEGGREEVLPSKYTYMYLIISYIF